MLALMDFSVNECQCALLCLLRAIQEHLETSKGWMPNNKDMPAVGMAAERGDGKPIAAHYQHCCSSAGVGTASPLITHPRGGCSRYSNWPEWAHHHHHHLATFNVADMCMCYLSTHLHHFHLAFAAFPIYQPDIVSRFKRESEGTSKVSARSGHSALHGHRWDWLLVRISVNKDQINSW